MCYNLSQSYYCVSFGSVSAVDWNASSIVNNLSQSYWNISQSNLSIRARGAMTKVDTQGGTAVPTVSFCGNHTAIYNGGFS